MTAHMNMRRIIFAAALVGLLPSQSLAQDEVFPRAGIYLDQFRTAETINDGFAISRPDDRGDMKFGAHLTFDYANDPLVFEQTAGDSDTELDSKVVEHHLVGTLSLSLGIADRLVLFAGIPVNLWQEGDGEAGLFAPQPDIAGMGDPWIGARLRLVGEPEDIVGLGLQAHVTLPITEAWNESNSYMGERGFTVQPELLFEIRAGVRITANLGAQFRKRTDFGNIVVGNELRYGLGVTVPLVEGDDQLNLHAELYGATPLGEVEAPDFELGNRETSPMEAILGLKYHMANGFAAGLAGGPGILRGYGSPDLRLVAQIGWAAPLDAVVEVEKEVVDEAVDTDGDGILDPDDACPNEPEDVDTFEDSDGCPDPDNDADGILDTDDQCPLDAEDTDGFEDEDGCPDTDNDKDGVADGDDQCPMDPEDVDTFEDTDGCPDADNDKDGVPDAEDACPLAPGKPSENAEENGCPKTVRVDTETGQIQILKRVEFATGKARILKRSFPILQEVKDTIAANPQIKKVRVEGHTDDRGKDKYNMGLSKARAKSVMEWLTGEGIEEERVEAYGCGESRPIDSNKTRDGRQANRRVEFHILEPAPKGGVRSTEGCEVPIVD